MDTSQFQIVFQLTIAGHVLGFIEEMEITVMRQLGLLCGLLTNLETEDRPLCA